MDTAGMSGCGFVQSQAISLDLLVHISETLAGLVRGMLGPCRQQTLLSTHTGKVMVTRDGLTVLSSLHLSHPIARCIMQSLQSYCSLHRDGSKTFILYLSQALRSIRDQLTEECEQIALSRTKLSLELSQFLSTDFEQIVKLVLDRVKSCSKRCDNETFVSTATSVLKSSLYTCLQKHLVTFFTSFLVAFLSLQDQGLAGFEQRLAHILQHFEMYHTKLSTQPQQKSRICHGVLLETDLSACQSHIGSTSPKAFALMDIDFDGDEKQRGGNVVSIHLTSTKAADVFSYKRRCLERVLNSLKATGLDVLLCSEKVPQYVIGLCRAKGVIVQCIEHEKLVFLSSVTGMPILRDLNQTVHKDDIFTANVSSFVRIGNKVCTLIELSESSCYVSPVNHMIVCAPTEGICDQVCQSLYKAVKTVHDGLQLHRWDSLGIPPSATISTALGLNSSDGADSLRSISKGICLEENDGCADGLDSVIGEKSMRNRVCEKLEMKLQFSSSSFNMSAFTISCGGTFEALMTSAISDYTPTRNSLYRKRINTLIQKMLISVPQSLHANLSTTKHGEQRQFTQTWTNLLSAVQQGRLVGLNFHGSVTEATENQCIEPVSAKLTLIGHVLQLLVQLLRVEAVVPVKTLHDTDMERESTDEDSED